MPKRMLALPFGKDDLGSDRLNFLRKYQSLLGELGWCVGIEAKGPTLEGWAEDCFREIKLMGGRFVWHLPNAAAKQLHAGVSDELKRMADEASRFKSLGLEAVTIHCAPAASFDPPEDAGFERYNSPMSAEEMLAHITAQVGPLMELNRLTGGILNIETVDVTNFRGGGYRVPTYLQLQTGCREDLLWLKRQTGVGITFDSEHFLCAGNLLERKADFEELPVDEPGPNDRIPPAVAELAKTAGYWLRKGSPPTSVASMSLADFVEHAKPRLFHFGAADRAIDEEGRIATHLPYDLSQPKQKQLLDWQIRYITRHRGVIGAVIEVTGQLKPEMYSPWSPRPDDDEEAKKKTYLTVIEEIEALQ